MRLVPLTLCVVLLGSVAAAEDLRRAFYDLPRETRSTLQSNLAETGLYRGSIDGLWGPGTAQAFAQAQESMAWPGYSRTAEAAGVDTISQVLWAFVQDPDFRASAAELRR